MHYVCIFLVFIDTVDACCISNVVVAGAESVEYETGWSLELELSGERQELGAEGCAYDEDGDIGG